MWDGCGGILRSEVRCAQTYGSEDYPRTYANPLFADFYTEYAADNFSGAKKQFREERARRSGARVLFRSVLVRIQQALKVTQMHLAKYLPDSRSSTMRSSPAIGHGPWRVSKAIVREALPFKDQRFR